MYSRLTQMLPLYASVGDDDCFYPILDPHAVVLPNWKMILYYYYYYLIADLTSTSWSMKKSWTWKEFWVGWDPARMLDQVSNWAKRYVS